MTVGNNVRFISNDKKIHRVILGLDVSTSCIGASIVIDDGESQPKIVKITHVVLKIVKDIKGIETLFLKKQIFEEEFLSHLKDFGITDVIIEEPLLSSNNSVVVGTLLRFNGMISDSIYRILGVVPCFISSYDSRMFSFPELCSLRKYNKKGKEYPLSHIKNDIKNGNLTLFGSYPYDIDKKSIMMNMVDKIYPDIEWVYDKKGNIKKENYDACDSLICALAYININRYGIEKPIIINSMIEENENKTIVNYNMKIWNTVYSKTLFLEKKIIAPSVNL